MSAQGGGGSRAAAAQIGEGSAPSRASGWLHKLDGALGGFKSAFRGAGARVLVLRLVYGFLIRASYALHGIYEQERWELTPRSSGYLSSYKQALGLLLNTLLIGRLAAKLPAPQLLQLALLASALNSAVEYASSLFTSPFALYVGLNLPISAVCGALTRTLLSALFAEAVPTRDAGAPWSPTLPRV